MSNPGKLFESTEALSDILRHFYCFALSEDSPVQTGRLAPNFDMLLMFNFNKPVRVSFGSAGFNSEQIEHAGVIGPLRKMLNYEMLPGMDMVVLVFTMDGFYRLFQTQLDQIEEDKVVSPDLYFQPAMFDDLWMVLKNIPSTQGRIEMLSEFVLSITKISDEGVIPLFDSLAYFDDPNIEPVKAIAQDLNLSERTIQLRFKKYTGFAPKEMLRFKRFKLVLNYVIDHSRIDIKWMEVIYQFGYHDQSHLIKDFQHYLGTTPKKFAAKLKDDLFCVSKPGKHY